MTWYECASYKKQNFCWYQQNIFKPHFVFNNKFAKDFIWTTNSAKNSILYSMPVFLRDVIKLFNFAMFSFLHIFINFENFEQRDQIFKKVF